ncbi:MAG: CRISPR-associated endonuclease Cas1 [Propionibacteriaceae bacterium]|nr:CRISPR-associated endonuclease Cas1 [Propionibacteriaceae bacterium]
MITDRTPSSSSRAARLKAQLRTAQDAERSLTLARAVITSKIRHLITLVQRFATPEAARDIDPDLAVMRTMRDLAPTAQGSAELMGVEGIAAKSYFHALSRLLPDPLRFSGRSRRPPLDLFNAALGYGYAILLGECVSALAAAGLDPNIGLLHADDNRRPSLALDLMEEFRPYVVDQALMQICRRGSLTPNHAQTKPTESGVFLTKAGKQALVDGYERRMLQVTGGALPQFTGSIRRHIYRQPQRLAAYVKDPQADWIGLSWR